jgi:tetratricopeptide (TPR) repeat protein
MLTGVVNEFRGFAENIVQARDIHGSVHVHQPPYSVTPHQLPADIPRFTGRKSALAVLDALASQDTSAVVITGTAGVGKTALAVHWAHHARARFPDGQLYVDLLGYASDSPLTPEQVLESFLHALGAPAEMIPARLDAQAAHYRSLLDGRQVLVVLDNAASPEQVRPLLPGSNGCLTLVTSRNSLAGLVSRNGASRLALNLLPPDEALTLVRHIVGSTRVDDDLPAAEDLIRRCASLPLALRIAAERAAAEEHTPLTDLVTDLGDERQTLDVLTSDDASTAMRVVFSWSYRRLPPECARMFRLLGIHPGPEFGARVAAALADLPLRQARRLLQTLKDAHLIQMSGQDRYLLHDVLRLYAAELAEAERPQRDAARRRMLVWYLRTADAADRALLPLLGVMPLGVTDRVNMPVPFHSREEAFAWCRAESGNLIAAARCAAEVGEHSIAARFPRALWSYFDLRKPWFDWITTYELGLTSARQIGNREIEAWITSALGVPYADLQRFDEASAYFTKAVVIRREIGDLGGLAGSLSNLGSVYRHQSRFDEALDCFHEALTLRGRTNDKRGEAITLNRLGAIYRDLGRFNESLDSLYKSLAIRRQINDRHGQGFAFHSLAATFEQLDRLDDAVDAYNSSLAARQAVGDRRGEAETLHCISKIMLRVDKPDVARERGQQALAIFTELGAPQTVDLASWLQALPNEPAPNEIS